MVLAIVINVLLSLRAYILHAGGCPLWVDKRQFKFQLKKGLTQFSLQTLYMQMVTIAIEP